MLNDYVLAAIAASPTAIFFIVLRRFSLAASLP